MMQTAEMSVTFEEDSDETEARASILLRGVTLTGYGRARRNPADPSLPVVGEELAAARALSELSHKLLEAAADMISEHEGRPARITI